MPRKEMTDGKTKTGTRTRQQGVETDSDSDSDSGSGSDAGEERCVCYDDDYDLGVENGPGAGSER